MKNNIDVSLLRLFCIDLRFTPCIHKKQNILKYHCYHSGTTLFAKEIVFLKQFVNVSLAHGEIKSTIAISDVGQRYTGN